MNGELLFMTVGLVVALISACLLPVAADGPEDRGDGRGLVVIPRHVKTSPYHLRTWWFVFITAVLGLAFLGLQRPSLPSAYAASVRAVATAITNDPASVSGYIVRLHPATQFFALAYIIGIALVARARPARRVAILMHGVLYWAISVLVQALMITAGIATQWPVAPFAIEATLANLLVGGVVILRLTFTTYPLPRATTVPLRRPRWAWDTVLACCSVIAVVSLLVIGYALLSEPNNLTSEWQVFIPLYAVSILFVLMSAPLWLLWWTNRTLPKPGGDRPAVDVIIPAYNEAENIGRLLRSVDAAAGRYGGPVRVLVSDDGSCDATAQISRDAFARFRRARGQLLTSSNGGQAAALNRALAITSAEIVVRIDADCVMGPEALVYSVPWFRDPQIGCVGAMEEPRTEAMTWFHRMRALETLFQFRFMRLGQSMVDGIVVVPGTFTAFRRGPATIAGGYTVGMNGEDCDLTMQIGRLGYRVVVDPRIRSYEDVPRTTGEFVEQRTRWARAGIHVYAEARPAAQRVRWAARLVLDDAPWFCVVLDPGGAGGPDLYARTRGDTAYLSSELAYIHTALCRWRGDPAGRQLAPCAQIQAVAELGMGTDLVCICVPQAAGHARSRDLASDSAVPGLRHSDRLDPRPPEGKRAHLIRPRSSGRTRDIGPRRVRGLVRYESCFRTW